ncbi:MAG: hypothetical protein KAT58_11905 [candidate division Zixibacteria bacterium]|nr:hypothetical protein [candidate division Zixibacteria bacterium]
MNPGFISIKTNILILLAGDMVNTKLDKTADTPDIDCGYLCDGHLARFVSAADLLSHVDRK